MTVLIVLLLLAFIGWATFTQFSARQQTSVSCPHDVATARTVVAECFGRSWVSVNGKGDVNYKPRMRARAPVISVSFEAAESGGSGVDIWCSAFTKRYGMLEHGQLVWRKKRAVAKALTQPTVGAAPAPAQAISAEVTVPSAPASLPPAGQRRDAAEPSTASGACVHSPDYHMEFGAIKIKGDPPYRYREFWHVTSCTKCGAEMGREGDEYWGDDMADIHWKWRK